jgi:excinuclease ABC subunit A
VAENGAGNGKVVPCLGETELAYRSPPKAAAGVDAPTATPEAVPLKELVFSENFACPEHGAVMEELSPRLFSFNSPYGACPHCHGLGSLRTFAAELVVPDPTLPVYAAIAPWSEKDNTYYFSLLYSVGQAFGFEIQTPGKPYPGTAAHRSPRFSEEKIYIETDSRYRDRKGYHRQYEGVLPMLERQYRETTSDLYKQKLEKYLIDQPCEVCTGPASSPSPWRCALVPTASTTSPMSPFGNA